MCCHYKQLQLPVDSVCPQGMQRMPGDKPGAGGTHKALHCLKGWLFRTRRRDTQVSIEARCMHPGYILSTKASFYTAISMAVHTVQHSTVHRLSSKLTIFT